MDINVGKDMWGFINEGRKSTSATSRLSLGNLEDDYPPTSARTSCASAAPFPFWSKSPDTPWTQSPAHTPPASPLLYHCLASLHRQEGNILSIAVSGYHFYTGSDSTRIHAWKLPDCSEMGCIKAKAGEVRAILASGRLLFTTHRDHKVRVWDVSQAGSFKPKKITTLPQRRPFLLHPRKNTNQHKSRISCIAYNNADNLLYTGSWDRTIKAWKITEKLCVDSFVAHDGHVNAIVINQQDGCVFSCSTDGTVKLWRRVFGATSHLLTMTLKFQSSPVNALAFSLSTNDCFIYSGSSDGLINFWEKEKISSRFNHGGFLQGHHFAVLCLESINNLILSGSEDATIRIWRREEENSFHTCLAVMDGHQGPVRCLASSMEMEDTVASLLVCSASMDQSFKVWRVKVYPSGKLKLENSNLAKGNQQLEIVESELNPVLSPTWVQKKIQSSPFQF